MTGNFCLCVFPFLCGFFAFNSGAQASEVLGLAADQRDASVPASEVLRLAADQGDASAQYQYAKCLEFGLGVPKAKVAAAQYYERSARSFQLAADQGQPRAQHWYGLCLPKVMEFQ
jgi:TPR repeat protein